MKKATLHNIFLISFFMFLIGYFSEAKVVVYKNLKDDFFTIDRPSKKAISLFSHENSKKSYLNLNLEGIDTDKSYLQFIATPGMCVFVNNELIMKLIDADTVKINLSPLFKDYGNKMIVSFFSPNEIFDHNNTRIVIEEEKEEGGINEWLNRKNQHNGVKTIFVLLLVSMISIIKLKDISLWRSYFELKSFMMQGAHAKDFILRSIFTVESFLILTFTSLLGTFLLFEWNLSIIDSYESILNKHVINFLLIFSFLLTKYFFLKGVTLFLGFSNFNFEQFFEFIRFSIWFLLLELLLVLSFGSLVLHISKYILFVSVILWNVRILRRILMRQSFQKVYLFSYICASEFIPAVVLINLVEQGN